MCEHCLAGISARPRDTKALPPPIQTLLLTENHHGTDIALSGVNTALQHQFPALMINATRRQEDQTRLILSYLLSHPDAEDTVEGIAQWWILEERISNALAAVGSALRELEERGWVIKRGIRYRLNKDRIEEIRSACAAAEPDE